MPGTFAAALSAEMRRTLKHEIDTLSDAAMIDFKQNDRESYNDFMDLVNSLLAFENEHGSKIYDDSFDEHFVVTPMHSPRETIYKVQYNGRPLSAMFDSMKEANADTLVKSARRAHFAPTATTFSFDSPAEFPHRPESEYRSDGTFTRDPTWKHFYRPGRWSSDWENAPTPELSPTCSPVSDADTTPRTKELMVTLDARWDAAIVNAKQNRGEDVTWPMHDTETPLRYREAAQHAAARKARHEIKETSNPFMDFIDSLPDPADNETFNDSAAPTWSFDALDDDSTLVTDQTDEEHSSQASTTSTNTSYETRDTPKRDRPVNDLTFQKSFLALDDDLADGMGHLDITDAVRLDAVHAGVEVVEAPRRMLRRVGKREALR
ncbi:hypothetical protein CLAFUW4_12167 [Fulvia fulva]|uniref:Uncharacterized protein n=1 Tax=Passalora fulva TaxID=5499 RepID=A0A9Q8USH9_PASFU|nr:uncharacterized protein CLAFUR5_11204 [Fulvia fulva]KAK4618119.1 hypothetical protein CLAFUR4_12172 [Fulvia fulva]KAK4619091.1 hypothetical protein CLAFUR0_12183 [Fulvia fulva]UJO20801.1 hypothetical protein CLAFUR5_11204 [Fulvia fulva]WPV18304.1 hypothetical protein CLAFUW4_12167 [Fulvia fulva]WPV32923.1 hypothetical protein CLAFUW7_12174 [Fulvia fulva]